MSKSKEPVRLSTPVGRVINQSLFEKDVYTDPKGREGVPSYKIELAFDEGDALAEFENVLVEAAVAEWGAEAADDYWENGKIRSPILNGDELAAKREAKGKEGDAYKGKFIIRAHTIFNAQGMDAPGGIYVCDANAVSLDFADRGKIYNGCHGLVSVTISCYDIDGRGVSLYLNGFQFVKDGDPLRSSDPSSLFSPMMGAGSESKGRRRRS